AEDRSIRFSSLSQGQGANTALPIWGYYMNKVWDDDNINISTSDFEKPENLDIELDCRNHNNSKNSREKEPDWSNN
ncbi:MAG: hypothetical protein ABEH43_06265, partial [Flavobacteriales bacterium]